MSVGRLGDYLPRLTLEAYRNNLRCSVNLVGVIAVMRTLMDQFGSHAGNFQALIILIRAAIERKGTCELCVRRNDTWASDVIGITRSHHLTRSFVEKFV